LKPWRCALTAFATRDNDIRVEEDNRPKGVRVELPNPVSQKVHAAGAQLVSLAGADAVKYLTCDDIFSPIYRVPVSGRRELFVANVELPAAGGYFVLVLHDPVTGETTRRPRWIGSKWPGLFGAQDPLVETPLVSTGRLPGIRRPLIVFEERVHNGTEYNGVIYHYFEVGPRLALVRVLALETRVLDPTDDRLQYVRDVEADGPNRLRLNLYSVDEGGRRKPLGFAVLARPGPRHAFHVLERRPSHGVDPGSLVSDCGTAAGDDTFLRKGCDFYY
jgi:hypothetical protein